MNIKDWQMTEKEMQAVRRAVVNPSRWGAEDDAMAQAALTKALWGVVDWLNAEAVSLERINNPDPEAEALRNFATLLKAELNRDGIPSPGGER